ncbi:hypothetical protein CMI37_31395 [Candidatus Pacearchaeota archaeon]|nr:hypothetical protein [Candidatus Pacearchaeota archaeon]|tara:strand:+ start:3185 stop:3367 length:183 start_codon:yes stop_codon:yes gene_type:complete
MPLYLVNYRNGHSEAFEGQSAKVDEKGTLMIQTQDSRITVRPSIWKSYAESMPPGEEGDG